MFLASVSAWAASMATLCLGNGSLASITVGVGLWSLGVGLFVALTRSVVRAREGGESRV